MIYFHFNSILLCSHVMQYYFQCAIFSCQSSYHFLFSIFFCFILTVFFMMIKWYIKPSIKAFCACATGLYQESFVCLHTCRTLENEQTLRRRAEMETAEYKLKLQVISNKYGQVEKELQVSVRIEFFFSNHKVLLKLLQSWSKNVTFLLIIFFS